MHETWCHRHCDHRAKQGPRRPAIPNLCAHALPEHECRVPPATRIGTVEPPHLVMYFRMRLSRCGRAWVLLFSRTLVLSISLTLTGLLITISYVPYDIPTGKVKHAFQLWSRLSARVVGRRNIVRRLTAITQSPACATPSGALLPSA